MSVTFFAVNAPSFPSDVFDNRDGSYEHGGPEFIISESTPFELNVANFNAPVVLELLGLRHKYYNGPEEGWDLVGSIAVEDLRDALDAIELGWSIAGNDRYKFCIKDLVMYCIAINSPLNFG